jgi:hypothetical protein
MAKSWRQSSTIMTRVVANGRATRSDGAPTLTDVGDRHGADEQPVKVGQVTRTFMFDKDHTRNDQGLPAEGFLCISAAASVCFS